MADSEKCPKCGGDLSIGDIFRGNGSYREYKFCSACKLGHIVFNTVKGEGYGVMSSTQIETLFKKQKELDKIFSVCEYLQRIEAPEYQINKLNEVIAAYKKALY